MKASALHDNDIDPKVLAWLGQYADVIEAHRHIKDLFTDINGQTILGEVDEHVTLKGPVYIGEGSHIHGHVMIEGPVYIGKNVRVSAQAQIRTYAYIGDNCVVGHSADIKKSICLNESKMQDGTFVGESVIGVAARVGSGVILANRKFNQTEVLYKNDNDLVVSTGQDFFGAVLGKHSRLGANCVLSPGTIIGEYTWVGSGCVLHGRYPPDLLITLKQELDIVPKERQKLRSGKGEYEYM